MIHKLIDYIELYTALSVAEKEDLKELVEIRQFEKHAVIFREGQISTDIYFVLEGCVRLFYDVDGTDKTAFFYTEGQFICAGESYTFSKPAAENYEVLENSTLCIFSKKTIEKLMQRSIAFENIARIAVENELLTAQRIIASFVTQSAEERYTDLLKNQGELFLRVPQHYIATFLGVSPETLSRIKQRVTRR
ncbi:Crp/Fnr family transcriptional regulator [Sphingobacterium tabacisoli]|uniref:Crp/Fnr family transcriptional regulator n=1 Tax=Sphingobacterium tabacisoli TaxID=2044855 RepID=A0ABW5L4E0_9SPHI|nr:Crp/Fnr family transcriptional regulator [Sphingobacterium tabacisoli]